MKQTKKQKKRQLEKIAKTSLYGKDTGTSRSSVTIVFRDRDIPPEIYGVFSDPLLAVKAIKDEQENHPNLDFHTAIYVVDHRVHSKPTIKYHRPEIKDGDTRKNEPTESGSEELNPEDDTRIPNHP